MGFFGGEEGTGRFEYAAGVGARGGHHGSNAMTRRSLVVNLPFESRLSRGGEARSYAGWKRVPTGGATRFAREEQWCSRTRVCVDRDGTVNDLGDGIVRMPFPSSSGTTGVTQQQRSGRPIATSGG
jgi:hypothetical protein